MAAAGDYFVHGCDEPKRCADSYCVYPDDYSAATVGVQPFETRPPLGGLRDYVWLGNDLYVPALRFRRHFLERHHVGQYPLGRHGHQRHQCDACDGDSGFGHGVRLAAGLLHYRKPRIYQNNTTDTEDNRAAVQQQEPSTYRSLVAAVAIAVCFAIQLLYDGSLVLGAMLGFAVFMMLGVMNRSAASDVFGEGIKMMAMVGFIMIAAQGFAAVMNATGDIQPLVERSMALFGGNKGMAALTMLCVGLLVTMGIGSSFSTLPIITAIYVPLCISLGFSPMATVAIVGTAGALGDAGSPASDSTLGPTMGLNADGQHDHIRDSVIPTFIHYNIPLMAAGWIAAMVL